MTSPGRTCLLIDDMIDTGGTITKAADLLFDAGATDVIVAATHGDLLRRRPSTGSRTAGSARSSSPTRCRSARSSSFDKLTVLSIAPLIARAIKEVFEDGSVTSLFDGDAPDRSGDPPLGRRRRYETSWPA